MWELVLMVLSDDGRACGIELRRLLFSCVCMSTSVKMSVDVMYMCCTAQLARDLPDPSAGVQRSRPTSREACISRHSRAKRLRSRTSAHAEHGNCTTGCTQTMLLHLCPTYPCHFGRPLTSCALAALSAHSTLVYSSLMLLQLLVTYYAN